MDYGIFYEYTNGYFWNTRSKGGSFRDVEIFKKYAIVIINSGLWRYLIGDTVRFTSLSPYRIRVTGRTETPHQRIWKMVEHGFGHCQNYKYYADRSIRYPYFHDRQKKGHEMDD
jgi:hypothetical protein